MTQHAEEEADLFFAKKARIFEWLAPQTPKNTKVILIAKLLKPELQPYLLPWPDSVAALSEKAADMKLILADARSANFRKNANAELQVRSDNHFVAEPSCRHCKGQYWTEECSQRPTPRPGNETRAGSKEDQH